MSERPVPVEAWHYSVAKVDLWKDSESIGSSTGFFYHFDNKIHLITCRHVIINEQNEHYPDTIKIKVHTSTTSNLCNRIIEIRLYDDEVPLWVDHSDNIEVDIACINIQEYVEPEDVILFWSNYLVLSSPSFLGIGERVIVLGYPKQYYDTYHNLPIGRTGFIASLYGADFNNHPYYLIDATLHSGTSGSPVLRPSGPLRHTPVGMVGGNTPMLIGVNSGEQEIVADKTRLGLHRVMYARYIEEILKQK